MLDSARKSDIMHLAIEKKSAKRRLFMASLNRKQQILKLIVEHFVKTAEPVGSQTLLDQYKLPYSSATIRNEMAELENLGYLEKTHTSSGRVPSASGYRYYVDYLREDDEIDPEAKQKIQALFSKSDFQIDNVIKQGCEIIAQMTHLTSVMLGPDGKQERLQKVQLIPINDSSAVAIFITDCGHIEHKMFSIPVQVGIKDVEKCIEIINDRIAGTALDNVVEKIDALQPIIAENVKHYDIVFKALMEVFKSFSNDRMNVFGRENVLEQPEFLTDIPKLKKLVKLLENDEAWKNLVGTDDVTVLIGDENSIQSNLDDIAVISAKLNISDNQTSQIALVGPTRMDYDKAIKILKYFQEALETYNKERE
jgi:heat-inducible transcriptional repressor